MPFRSKSISVRTSDGRNILLLEPLIYDTDAGATITIPAGACSDGTSTPRAMWGMIPSSGPTGSRRCSTIFFTAKPIARGKSATCYFSKP